jgi:hypothetical protein
MRQPVEPRMNFVEIIPSPGGFADERAVAFGLAGLVMLGAALTALAAAFRFALATPAAARPLVLFVVEKQCRLVVFIVGLDDIVEPLADRHAGAARGRACSLTRIGAQASQVPRTARFHSYDQTT